MAGTGRTAAARGAGREGFTLLEVMIAAILLLLLFYGLARVHAGGVAQMILEEHRREATALLQAQLEGIRRDYDYDALDDLDGEDTDVSVDGMTYTLTSDVTVGVPEAQATTVEVTVTWTEDIGPSGVERSLTGTTILARGLAWVN